MESLLANYASSDEEGGGRQEQDDAGDIRTSPPPSKPFSTSIPSLRSSSSPLFSSLPPPKSSSSSSATSIATSSSSSLFGSLPPPKASSSSIFSSLRPPRSTTSSSSSSSSSSSLFGSLPPPNASSSSIFSSLPPPRSTTSASSPSSLSSSSSSLFSSLPPPKSQQPKPPAPSEPTAKKVVQFRPPIDPSLFKPRDDDDEEDSGRGKRRIQDFSSKPLSSIIPAPKNTLGLGASSRRSVIEADVPAGSTGAANAEEAGGGSLGDQESFGEQWAGRYASIGADGQADSGAVGGDVAAVAPGAGSYDLYGGYGSYEGYDNYGSYGRHWDYGSSEAGAASAVVVPESARTSSKRGRDEIPSEILEVKQDELIKNRPREDQVRLTGIAFGPAYQPAPSAKGKPSKLHKRKHQIGALYYDMRQKEMELAERRAKGFLTKKETQAKYGW